MVGAESCRLRKMMAITVIVRLLLRRSLGSSRNLLQRLHDELKKRLRGRLSEVVIQGGFSLMCNFTTVGV